VGHPAGGRERKKKREQTQRRKGWEEMFNYIPKKRVNKEKAGLNMSSCEP